jgi:hypothetical protein
MPEKGALNMDQFDGSGSPDLSVGAHPRAECWLKYRAGPALTPNFDPVNTPETAWTPCPFESQV